MCDSLFEQHQRKNAKLEKMPTPRELVAHLNEFIIGQERVKETLAVAVVVLFHYDDAGLKFNDCAIREIARRAKARGTGARALRSIMEGLMLDIMYELPERQPGQTYTITEQVARCEKSLFGVEGA